MKLKLKQQIDSILGYLLIFLNIVPAKILGFFIKRNHEVRESPDAIVFIKMVGLGSVFMALDAIQSIKEKHPSSKFILICGKGIKPGIAPIGLFDEVYEVNDESFFALTKSSIQTLIKCWQIKKLWVVDLEVYSKLSTIFSLWTLGLNRFGFYLNSVWFRLNLNTHNVFFNEFILVEENYKRIAFEMGCTEIVKYKFPIHALNKEPHDSLVKKYIAVNNTCSELGKERIAPEVLIASIVAWVVENTDYDVALLGAPVDESTNLEFIQQHLDVEQTKRTLNIAGRFSFFQYYQFLYEECAMLITVDTGPLHFARRLNVPTISLWGPTHPSTRIQEDERNQVVYLAKSCSPCVHMVDILPCGGDNVCMKNIAPHQVVQKIQKMISIL